MFFLFINSGSPSCFSFHPVDCHLGAFNDGT